MNDISDETILREIRLEKVSLFFDGKEQESLFHDIDISWNQSGFWELFSEQAVGKSLLLQMVGGILAPPKGQIFYNGLNLFDTEFESSLQLRLQVGYAFDLGGLLHNRTLFENLMLPLQYHKVMSFVEAERKIKTLFEQFQIMKYQDLRPSFVSGSVRKMSILLRSILFHPRFLILDDPFVGLSPFQRQEFVTLIETLRNKTGFLHLLFTDSTKSHLFKKDGSYELSSEGLLFHEKDLKVS
jgi:phospholipid/cholesterol/gamma-HCH transport system ATP-binding protein